MHHADAIVSGNVLFLLMYLGTCIELVKCDENNNTNKTSNWLFL